jgi:hypothetical protein
MPHCSRRLALLASATVLGIACSDGAGPDHVGPAATLAVIAGDGQTDTVGQELPQPLAVRVTDAKGRPIAGQSVNFRVIAGGGSVFAGVALTNAEGEARERWTLGTVARETGKVEARVVDPATGTALLFGVLSAVTVADAPASATVAAGDAQSIEVGMAVPESLAVRVVDRFGNGVSGVPVTWTTADGGAVAAPSPAVTGTDGVARARWTLGTAAGTQRVIARAGSLPEVRFTATAQAQSGIVQRLFADWALIAPGGTIDIGVRVLDALGFEAENRIVRFAVVAGGGSVDLELTRTNLGGRAFATWKLGPLDRTTNRATATVEGFPPVTFDIVSSAAPPAPPTNVRAVANSASKEISVTWVGATGAWSHNVYFSRDPAMPPASTTWVNGTPPPWIHEKVGSGETWYYAVTTVGYDRRESARSAVASATMP